MYLATNSKITIYLLLLAVETQIKDTPKENKSPFKGQSKITLYKITSERGYRIAENFGGGNFS